MYLIVVSIQINLNKVIPIYKKGDKHDNNNYRPISILPVISMIVERHARVILDWDFYTPSSTTMFSDLKLMSFPERGIYMKDIEMFKQSGEMPLNTLGRHLLWRLIYMQACYLTIVFYGYRLFQTLNSSLVYTVLQFCRR